MTDNVFVYLFLFIYKLHTQCHTIKAETVQNNNRHWRRPTQVLKHLRVALRHKHETIKLKYRRCKWPLKTINRRQMNLIRRQTIVPDIDYTITEMEFTSIDIRMTLTNM